jgi:hypothetical protein
MSAAFSRVTQYPPAFEALIMEPTSGVGQHRVPLSPLTITNVGGTYAKSLSDREVAAHESGLYASGTLSMPKAFAFSSKKIRIDWRALAGIDIDKVVCLISRIAASLIAQRTQVLVAGQSKHEEDCGILSARRKPLHLVVSCSSHSCCADCFHEY